MNPLVIKLTGSIDSSNFDEWKTDLIAQLHAVNRELVTDDDFVTAAKQVKAFKTAEDSLKRAKQSAIEQANDIQRLFTAIDEVIAESREIRLWLDRQVKARKLDLKFKQIQSAIDAIKQLIDQQSEEFKAIDHSNFLDWQRFETATKGKASIKGVQAALDQLSSQIRLEISDKAGELADNKKRIDAIPVAYRILFPDRQSLLALPDAELKLEIEKRIAQYQRDQATQEADKKAKQLKILEDLVLNPETGVPDSEGASLVERYRISIDLLSTREQAISVARLIKETYSDNALVTEIRLARHHDG